MPKVYINQVKRLRVRERVIIVGICKYVIKINIAHIGFTIPKSAQAIMNVTMVYYICLR